MASRISDLKHMRACSHGQSGSLGICLDCCINQPTKHHAINRIAQLPSRIALHSHPLTYIACPSSYILHPPRLNVLLRIEKNIAYALRLQQKPRFTTSTQPIPANTQIKTFRSHGRTRGSPQLERVGYTSFIDVAMLTFQS